MLIDPCDIGQIAQNLAMDLSDALAISPEASLLDLACAFGPFTSIEAWSARFEAFLMDANARWTPIATAPRNGAWILVGRMGSSVDLVQFQGHWQSIHGDFNPWLAFPPTHWQAMEA